MRRALSSAWCLVLTAACAELDLNSARFSCDAGADCGSGYECRPQASGGKGRCFKLGECVDAEQCDGVDNNCNGRIDETFPEEGQACSTGKPGACSPGKRSCSSGALGCTQTLMPSQELCNGIDDDCDGSMDEGFDLTSDDLNCGVCAARCETGNRCRASECQESDCGDGLDNDRNGLGDCLDDACLSQLCGPSGWRCGAISLDAGPGPRPDAGPDPDAGSDGGSDPDAGSDAGPDPDAGIDAGPDPDAGIDAGPDPDAGFDAGSDPDAGSDAGPDPDGGLWDGGLVRGCFAPERACSNGLDDDGDGQADCLDIDCENQVCASAKTCINRLCQGP